MVMIFKLIVVFSAATLAGCAGVRPSYISLIEHTADGPAISMKLAQSREVLAISNGFPGWWGIYPTVVSASPEVASVTCSFARSWIPFRAPGVLIGGEVCQLNANRVGETWLLYGNKFAMGISPEAIARDEKAVRVIITDISSDAHL